MPTTVGFYAWYTPELQAYIAKRPYIRLGKNLVNEIAILYTSEHRMDGIFKELGSDFLNTFPEIYGLLDNDALNAAGIIRVQQQPYLDLSGRGVVMGFVDTGIDYTLPIFRYEDGTSKIKYIWDQTIPDEPHNDVIFGTIFTQKEINEALINPNPFSVVPHRDTVGHGTYLASIAAGRKYNNFIGAAPDAEIIMVKLKKARPYYLNKFLVPSWQENAFSSIDILLGITYIFDKAADLLDPSVVCLGLGTNFGGHSGQTRLENYISFLSNARGFAVCTAAGNESNARHHTEGKIDKSGDTAVIEIKVGEIAESLSVYVWYPGWDKISFSLKSPTGEVVSRIPFETGTTFQKKLIFETSTVTILYQQNEDRYAIIQVQGVVPGTWDIELYGNIIIDGRYHAWLPLTGFISPDIEFVAPSPNFTVVVPSTSTGAISSGAYNHKDNSLYINSSWGPTANQRPSPDLVSPGVNVQGYYPTGSGTMTGTSVSAAITAGAAALMLQWAKVDGNYPSLNGYRLKSFLIRGCDREDSREYPNPQWGYGRLDLMNTFNSLREE